jgi:hypothetical protein
MKLFHDEGSLPASIPSEVSNPAFRKRELRELSRLSLFDQATDFVFENRGIIDGFFEVAIRA